MKSNKSRIKGLFHRNRNLNAILDKLAGTLLRNLDLKNALENIAVSDSPNINIKEYLEKFAKKEEKERISDYNYRLACEKHRSNSGPSAKFSPIYYDVPYQFILLTGKIPVANIGFKADIETSTIIIKQIQGVSGRKEYLEPLRWEKMLVNILADWAKQNGAKKMEIIKAQSNPWYNEHRAQSMYLKYDVTAKRCGFKFNADCERYVKILD